MAISDDLRTAARGSLLSFAALMHHQFEPVWHHRLIAAAMERVASGDPAWRRLLISLPPRHGKTLLVSKMFPAWYMASRPNKNVIVATYGGEYADDLGRDARAIVTDPVYESLTGVGPDESSQAIAKWKLVNEAQYYAVSVGSSLTGRGANHLCIDDAVKNMEEAESEGARDRAWNWFLSTAMTRLEKDASVVIVMTRWHEDDIMGRILAGETRSEWKTLFFPAVAEADETDEHGLIGPPGEVLRREGEALWPEKYDLPALERIKKQVGSRVWSALYQGRPAPAEGAVFLRSWWQSYDLDSILDGVRDAPWVAVYQSWDTAVSKARGSARSCCTTWGLGPSRQFYLIDVWTGRVEFPELRAAARDLARQWRPSRIWVEAQQTGAPLVAELSRDQYPPIPITGVRLKGDKLVRARLVSGMVETGRVFLPRQAPWREAYIDELAAFPTGVYADQVDSTSQGLQLLAKEEVRLGNQYAARESRGKTPVSIYGR